MDLVRKSNRNSFHAQAFGPKKKKRRHRKWTASLAQGERMMKFLSTMMKGHGLHGLHGTTTTFVLGYRKKSNQKTIAKGKRKKMWTGWKPKNDVHKFEFRRKVMEKDGDKFDEDLITFQKTVETAAGKVAHCTEAERENIFMSTPENVRLREKASARCTKRDQEESVEETSQQSKG